MDMYQESVDEDTALRVGRVIDHYDAFRRAVQGRKDIVRIDCQPGSRVAMHLTGVLVSTDAAEAQGQMKAMNFECSEPSVLALIPLSWLEEKHGTSTDEVDIGDRGRPKSG